MKPDIWRVSCIGLIAGQVAFRFCHTGANGQVEAPTAWTATCTNFNGRVELLKVPVSADWERCPTNQIEIKVRYAHVSAHACSNDYCFLSVRLVGSRQTAALAGSCGGRWCVRQVRGCARPRVSESISLPI
jgi:hypothetical protein